MFSNSEDTSSGSGDKLRTMKLCPKYNPAADTASTRQARIAKVLENPNLNNDEKVKRILRMFGKKPGDEKLDLAVRKLVLEDAPEITQRALEVRDFMKSQEIFGIFAPASAAPAATLAPASTPILAPKVAA